ncbi:MAG TPA: hypothetical protein VJP77_04925 [Planctomycetota bacterium]|nr:hypothetical protein [Planctomycetota bacterium]
MGLYGEADSNQSPTLLLWDKSHDSHASISLIQGLDGNQELLVTHAFVADDPEQPERSITFKLCLETNEFTVTDSSGRRVERDLQALFE